MAPAVSSFDPDAPDEGWDHDVWDGGFDGGEDPADVWVDPIDDLVLDSPTARADFAYGRAVDQATPTELLRTVLADVGTWDVDALLAEVAVHTVLDEVPDATLADRPDVMVLRSLVKHPNRPDDLPEILVATWLEDSAERSPWPAIIGLAQPGTIDEDVLVTAVSEACDAARQEQPPDWAMVMIAAAAARPDGSAVHDLLALAPFPHDQPSRLWPDADQGAKGLPGGARARAKVGAEQLGWDGRRFGKLVEVLSELVMKRDKQARRDGFCDQIIVCPHGPVVITPSAITLPNSAAGPKPYVAMIVGSHPVFRLKRDWPDRNDAASGTAWTWEGGAVLESRDLGCDGCRNDPDGGKRYVISTGTQVAAVRLKTLREVLDQLDAGGAPG